MSHTCKKSVNLVKRLDSSINSQNHLRFWILFMVFYKFILPTSLNHVFDPNFEHRYDTFWQRKPNCFIFIHFSALSAFIFDQWFLRGSLWTHERINIGWIFMVFVKIHSMQNKVFNLLFSVVSCDSAMTGWT